MPMRNMPIFWTDEEVAWLEGSHLIEQIAERQASIEEDYDKICEVAPEFKRFSLEFFMWARMIVSSRNFGGQVEEGVKTSGLVPYADMLNHLRPRETVWTYNLDKEAFTITSCAAISAGSAVYDSYGKKCQHRFLLNYGFSVEDIVEAEQGRNPNQIHIEVSLDREDPLWGAKQMLLERTSGDSDTDRTFRISTVYSDSGTSTHTTREAFSYMRYCCANQGELEFGMQRHSVLEEKGHREDKEVTLLDAFAEPICERNEEGVLRMLASMMQKQLRAYPSTLAEDIEALKDRERLTPFSNEVRRSTSMMMGDGGRGCIHVGAIARK